LCINRNKKIKIDRGVHPSLSARRSPSPNSDALPSSLLPLIFFVFFVFSLFVALPPFFLSGVARNVYWGPRLFPSFSLPLSPLLFFFSFPFLCFLLFSLLFLRSKTPEMQQGGLGERCELLQQGLGRSPSRNRIWCILALKDEIWW